MRHGETIRVVAVARALDFCLWWERVPAAKHLRNGLGYNVSACEGGYNDVGAYEGEGVRVGGRENALVEAGVAADGGAEGSGVVFGG